MDPYEQTQPEHEDAHHTALRLRNRAMLLWGMAHGSRPSPKATIDKVATVNQTKSSSIATFVRKHPQMPRIVRIGFAVLGLGGLAALLARKRFRR